MEYLSKDIGPGMCLIDQWIRKILKKNMIKMEIIAKSGKINKNFK